jgi:hypothetical protein
MTGSSTDATSPAPGSRLDLLGLAGFFAVENRRWYSPLSPAACGDALAVHLRASRDGDGPAYSGRATEAGFAVTAKIGSVDRYEGARPVLDQVGVQQAITPAAVVGLTGSFRPFHGGTLVDVRARVPGRRIALVAAAVAFGAGLGVVAGAGMLLAVLLLVVPLALDLPKLARPFHELRIIAYWIIVGVGGAITVALMVAGGDVGVVLVPLAALGLGALVLLPALDRRLAVTWPTVPVHAAAALVIGVCSAVGLALEPSPFEAGEARGGIFVGVGAVAGVAVAFAFCAPAVVGAADVRAGAFDEIAAWLRVAPVPGLAPPPAAGRLPLLRSPVVLGIAVLAGAAAGMVGWAIGTGEGVDAREVGKFLAVAAAALALASPALRLIALLLLILGPPVVAFWNGLWRGQDSKRRFLFVLLVGFVAFGPLALAWSRGGGWGEAVLGWCALLAVGLAGVLGKAIVAHFRERYGARRWPTVQGKVLAAEIRPEKRGVRTFYRPHVVYEYAVGGGVYRGERIGFGDLVKASRLEAETFMRPFVPGLDATVYYQPSKPVSAVLVPRPGVSAWLELALPVIPAVMSLVGAYLFARGAGLPLP